MKRFGRNEEVQELLPVDQTDRNLLFGVLSLQADLIDAAQFAEACSAWSARKDKGLADLLVERGWLTPEDRRDIERLLERKLKKHSGDAQATLAAAFRTPTRDLLAGVSDAELQQSLSACLQDRPGSSPAAGGIMLSTTAYQPQNRERYTLTRLHARGGIGQVWLAQDDDLGREVALKEVRADRSNHEAIMARFLEEARITGQLQHPGIVPVYELTRRSEDQRPFYTMRFVRGRTLREASREYHRKRQAGQTGPLDLRELLGQFVAVCNAIAYAHDRGVLHRDLKGPNVIVGDFGEVIVLDWGLAKLFGQAEASTAMPVKLEANAERGETVQGQVIGTPGYMSPEQATGRLDRVDVRSDVYGLGAILYEILTGEPPFAGEDRQEVIRRVAVEEPVPPGALVADTPRALAAICLKALAMEPAHRYNSAAELATEIRHYLADEPVTAYRDPLLAKAARSARRHRTLVAGLSAAALVAVVCLTAATVLLSASNRRESAARVLAQEQSAEAESQSAKARANFQLARDAVEQYCTKVSEDPRLKEKDLEELRKELLQSATEFHQKFVQQHRDDPTLEADLGRAYLDLANLVANNAYAQGIALCGQAAAIYEKLITAHPEEGSYPLQLAEAHILMGGTLDLSAQVKEARENYERALMTLDSARREHGSSQRLRSLYLLASGKLSYLQRYKVGSNEQAIATCRKAAAFLDDDQAAPASELKDIISEADLYGELGSGLAGAGHVKEAVVWCSRSLQLLEPRLTRTNRPANLLYSLNSNYGAMSQAYLQASQHHEALTYRRKAVDVGRELAEAHPGVSFYQFVLGMSYHNLAVSELNQKEVQQGLADLKKAVEVKEQLVARLPDAPDYQANLVRSLDILSEYTPDLEQARTYQHRAESLSRELNRLHPGVAQYQQTLAFCYGQRANMFRRAGKLQEAVAAMSDSIDVFEKLIRTTDGATYRTGLVGACMQQVNLGLQAGKPQVAAEAFRKATALQPENPALFHMYGTALMRANRLVDATEVLSKAVTLKPDYAEAQCNLGLSLVRQGRFVEGRVALLRGHEIGSKQPGWGQPSAQWLRQADRLIQLDGRLTAIFDDKAQPVDSDEKLALADLCQRYKQRYAAAARFYSAAFAEHPQFADDHKAAHRYNAACAAAQAGCGKGEDAGKLSDKERSHWRQEALKWLQADLEFWSPKARGEKPGDPALAQKTLQGWQKDSDLAGVRDLAALAGLPEAERQAWQKFWQDVVALMTKAAVTK
jgi:serine/threonine-protein kinase